MFQRFLSDQRGGIATLMGVAALVALFSGYHGWYDHVLALLPTVALFRIAKDDGSTRRSRIAGTLFGAMTIFLVAPGGLYALPYPFNNVYVVAQATVWLATLIFLIVTAPAPRAGRETDGHCP